jgi:hypothetical protein
MNLIEGGFPVEHRPADPSQELAIAPATAAPVPAAAPATAAEEARPDASWIPIRSLGPRHRERIVSHLTALDERSR